MKAAAKAAAEGLLKTLKGKLIPLCEKALSDPRDPAHALAKALGRHLVDAVELLETQREKIRLDGDRIAGLQKELDAAVKELARQEREVQALMVSDTLTGLYARHHLTSVLEEEVARCQRYGHSLAVMMFDIDEFKSINENHGHAMGDAMLAYVGKLIKKNTRKFDRSFRYGEEEFIVLLPETDLTLAYLVAERIRRGFERKAFRPEKNTADGEVHRTLSIGLTAVYAYSTAAMSMDDVLRQSTEALQQARKRGGNICVRYEKI